MIFNKFICALLLHVACADPLLTLEQEDQWTVTDLLRGDPLHALTKKLEAAFNGGRFTDAEARKIFKDVLAASILEQNAKRIHTSDEVQVENRITLPEDVRSYLAGAQTNAVQPISITYNFYFNAADCKGVCLPLSQSSFDCLNSCYGAPTLRPTLAPLTTTTVLATMAFNEVTLPTEAPLVTEIPVTSTEASVVTDFPVVTTETPVMTEVPVTSTDISVMTKFPVITTEAPVVTEVPVITTETPVVTEAPVITTETPVVTEVPLITTETPVLTEVPVVSTEGPVVTEAPVITTGIPIITSTRPPTSTELIVATAASTTTEALISTTPNVATGTLIDSATAPTANPIMSTEIPVSMSTQIPVVLSTEIPVAGTETPVVLSTEIPVVLSTQVPVVLSTDVPVAVTTEVPAVIATESPVTLTTETPNVLATDVPVSYTDPIIVTTETPNAAILPSSSTISANTAIHGAALEEFNYAQARCLQNWFKDKKNNSINLITSRVLNTDPEPTVYMIAVFKPEESNIENGGYVDFVKAGLGACMNIPSEQLSISADAATPQNVDLVVKPGKIPVRDIVTDIRNFVNFANDE